MSATLGGLLKDYRLQKNISQLEIAFAMGWKEPSRLSRIEQGRVESPSRELLDQLIETMKLDETEKDHLLLSGGYLPTENEIEKIREKFNPLIRDWRYPVYVTDFSWRVLHWNKALAIVYNFGEKDAMFMKKNHPRTLDLIFDPNFFQLKYLKGKELENWNSFLLNKLVLFKTAQAKWTKENWYLNFVKKMMSNEIFRKLWVKAKIPNEGQGLSNYERKSLVNLENRNIRLEFHIFDVPLLNNPRYIACLHTPANKETFEYFEQEKFNPLPLNKNA